MCQSMIVRDRVTVTLERTLVTLAKRRAHARGTSVSGVVAESLRDTLQRQGRGTRAPSFAERWRGRFELATDDPADVRQVHLQRKYRLR